VYDLFCPWCAEIQTVRVARVANGRAELECGECGLRWLAEPVLGQPPFAFVSAAIGDNNLEPLLAGEKP
jgi:hypothetical protein